MDIKIELPNPLLIDGGLSTVLEAKGHKLDHHLWTALLIDTNPRAIIDAHLDFLRAGARCIITASYQATIPGFIATGHSKKEAIQKIRKSVELAEKAKEIYLDENPLSEQIYIAISIGPYGAYLADGSEFRGNYPISDELLYDFHKERLKVLMASKADLFACETIPSAREAKILAELTSKIGKPTWISFSCQDESAINDGTSIEDIVSELNHYDHLIAIGVNCTSPQFIPFLIKKIKRSTNKRIIVYPNSGETYHADSHSWIGSSSPVDCAELSETWIELGADIIGGCCRMGPEHIKAMHDRMKKV